MRWLRGAVLLLIFLWGSAAAETWYPSITDTMPQLSIITEDGGAFITGPLRETKLQGDIAYVDARISLTDEKGNADLVSVPAQVKARGNYTLEYPKKSVRIRFEQKQPMLTLHDGQAYKNWVLLAEWKDLSQLHTPVGLFLSHAILGTDGYYCSDGRNVEVWVNGEYWGVYLLAEQQEVKPGRTGLPEVPDGYTGTDVGYFFEYDAYFAEERDLPGGDPTFEVFHEGLQGEQYGYTIKSDINHDRQRRYLAAYVRRAWQIVREATRNGRSLAFNTAGNALVAAEHLSPEEAVSQVVDLQSLVDMYILHEIICNPDVGWSSFYISLDMTAEGKRQLVFDAPWDFDSCFGIRSGYEANTGFFVPGRGNPWFEALIGEKWFQARVRARWAALMDAQLPQQALALIDELTCVQQAQYQRNYARWPERITSGNHELIEEVNGFRSQQEAADYCREWLRERFEWLDSQWRP